MHRSQSGTVPFSVSHKLITNAFKYPRVGLLLVITTDTIPVFVHWFFFIFLFFSFSVVPSASTACKLCCFCVGCDAWLLLSTDPAAGNQSVKPVIPPQKLAQARWEKAQGSEMGHGSSTELYFVEMIIQRGDGQMQLKIVFIKQKERQWDDSRSLVFSDNTSYHSYQRRMMRFQKCVSLFPIKKQEDFPY